MHGSVETVEAGLGLPRRRGHRSFVLWIAGISAVLIFAGFAKTFYVRPLFVEAALPSLAIVHGIVMSLWVVLFVTQVWLVARGNIRWHRRLGVTGMVLAPLVLVLAVAMGIQAMRAGHTPVPQVTPQQFLAVPLFNIVAFAGLAGTGLAMRKRREAHRRLMLLAMLCLLPPAVARIPQALDVFRAGSLFLAIGVMAAIIVACAVRDTRLNHHLHPAFVFGGTAAILALPLALVVSHTPWWQRFAELLM
ncbi:MAG TPA: hypothetical protein VFP92_02435 [Rhodanobacteraceae bacterium]|nr:hypothetical protein [Rhodanobacteraceae bacterium]